MHFFGLNFYNTEDCTDSGEIISIFFKLLFREVPKTSLCLHISPEDIKANNK